MAPLSDRFKGFGFAVHEVDGHDIAAIGDAIEVIRRQDRQSVVIADTVKGKGVPFAEGQPVWHYRSLDDKSFAAAMAALPRSAL
jgi:transketolase